MGDKSCINTSLCMIIKEGQRKSTKVNESQQKSTSLGPHKMSKIYEIDAII